MSTYKTSTMLWLVMLALTCIAAYFAEQPKLSLALIATVLLLTASKATLIVDHFMGLRNAPLLWRGLMVTYVPLISLIITATYAVN